MHIINPTDKITSVTPSSENTSYLATNIQDNFRTNPWKSNTASAATLTLAVSTGSAAIGLSYMNSATVNVLVETAGPVTVHDQLYSIDSANPNLFVNYGTVASACTISLSYSDPGSVAPYCGIVRCSSLYTFLSPDYGLSEGMKDYSITKRYNSGALYYKSRTKARTFSGKFDVVRDSTFYTFMYTIIKEQGQNPMFWKITDLSNQDWAIFAECEMPKGSHSMFSHSNISFSLLEAI